ncbi:hypothetical protein K466DRAFT_606242 [Polyporus arcularius HHB13444]|uniref:Uncharacterized protein n=1 Tax=Polyporus arcularius HHB13444 TaxID=1314778 RepID=A0A5C3NRC9_9APHY|nr:hypothetical protein K466DRAFT_606242 [Polyporus arcularius HHB13444]
MCLTSPSPRSTSSSSWRSSTTSTHDSSSDSRSAIAEDVPNEPLVRADAILHPAGFCRAKYGPRLEEDLAGARSGPCSGCDENGEPCVQSNGGAWRCKRCLVKGLSGCEWEINTYAILGLKKDASLRKPHIDYERLEELEADGLQVDRLEVVLAAGLKDDEYGPSLPVVLADARAAPCSPCLRIGQACTQTNAAALGDPDYHAKPKIDRRRLAEQRRDGLVVDSRSLVIRSNRRVNEFINAHAHLLPPNSRRQRLQSGFRRHVSPNPSSAPITSRSNDSDTVTLSQIAATQARHEVILRKLAQRLDVPLPVAETVGELSSAVEDEK